jgi:fructosamine-3-kinase
MHASDKVHWRELETAITGATGQGFEISEARPVAGGCINESFELKGRGGSYFVKTNSPDSLAMFEAEAAGLEAIRASNCLRAPRPIASVVSGGISWLVLEFIAFSSNQGSCSRQLGQGLAAMHRCAARRFGWERDNTIGATPQPNTQSPDWVDFFRRERLGFQGSLAQQNGAPPALLGELRALQDRLEVFFKDYHPVPSLLHGDLWGGNWAADAGGEPVIFDPAVYWGDREADIAMTELFGGFDSDFYGAYNEAWPLDPGYSVRRDLYNLYHVLNHFNLFGGGYARQAQSMVGRLLAEISA